MYAHGRSRSYALSRPSIQPTNTQSKGQPLHSFVAFSHNEVLSTRLDQWQMAVCSIRIMTVTDKAKKNQDWRCVAKDQSIQTFALPQNSELWKG